MNLLAMKALKDEPTNARFGYGGQGTGGAGGTKSGGGDLGGVVRRVGGGR